ncbi:TetR/AcrR family transcriptional regulator [Metabacillus litoralis]|uniref:TetR/AcrR family transcriptional regulator n=1 Tax=Metabacillus litoralis TaxID=152268 RepID=UPI001CFF3F3C|nr:TetR/AcrR family transcriptional regulator [Metabacillus litoralis]
MQTLKEEVRNNILKAALKEFGQYGYASSSMRRIAGTAGITTGNIYRYFKNKDDLFKALLEPSYEKFISYMLVIKNEIDTTFTKDVKKAFQYVRLVDETVVALLKEDSIEIKILLNLSEGSIYEESRQHLIDLTIQILEIIFTISKETDKLSTLDQNIVNMLATSIIEGMCMILRNYDDGETVKQLVDELIHIYSVGIAEKLK